jgi:exodeoxyribonuclease VII large subunit
MPSPTIYSLSDITNRLASILAPHEERAFWVQAEVSGASLRGGHVYATLVESAAGKQVAKLDCVIWSRDHARIAASFRKAGLDFSLANGMKACLHCRLSFHAVFGLKLVVIDADPRFVLGELELRRREIIERLQKDGETGRNATLRVPALPLRLGLITSRDSAAYNDVVKTLRDSGYGFRVLLADALMQGEKAEHSILRAIDALEALAPDLVIIARGGGNRTELASLDNDPIARRIAACTVPVWTAIGHETDTSVLDVVAHTAFKTPTALAEGIVTRYRDAAHRMDTARVALLREWTHRIETQRNILGDDAIGIRQGSRKLYAYYRSELVSTAERVHLAVTGRFAAQDQRLAVAARHLRIRAEHASGEAEERARRATAALRDACAQQLDSARRLLAHRSVRLRFDRVRPLFDRGRGALARAADVLRRGTRTAILLRRQRAALLRQRLRGGPVLSRVSHLILLNEQHARLVEAHDPVNALKRGFAIVTDASRRILKSVADTRSGEAVRIAFHDGDADATITHTEDHHG